MALLKANSIYYIKKMRFEDFQLIDNEVTDSSILKRDFVKIHHQQAAKLTDSDQNTEFIFRENSIYHQIGNAYLQCELSTEKGVAVAANRVPVNGDARSLVKNAFAYCFKEAGLSTTGGSDMERKNNCGQISTITRALTSTDGNLLSCFDQILNQKVKLKIHHYVIILLTTMTYLLIKEKLKDNYH